MADQYPTSPDVDLDYECIDESLGQEIWRLDDPETTAEVLDRLQGHLEFCAHCRSIRLIHNSLESGLKSGELKIQSPQPVGWIRPLAQVSSWMGGVAAAAAVVLMFVQVPVPLLDNQLVRRGSDPEITRPVADEIISNRRPVIQWENVEGANRYRVEVTAVGSDFTFSQTVETPEVKIPADQTLPGETRFRVNIQPVPIHLVKNGGYNSSFKTAKAGEYTRYRWSMRSELSRTLGWAGMGGFALGVLGLIGLRRRG